MTPGIRSLVVWVALGVGGCKCQSPPAAAPGVAAAPRCVPTVLVARQGTPTVDGKLDEPVWHSAAATEMFVHESVNRVVPHTEARSAWDAEALYLVLYMADEDLRRSDQVRVAFEGLGAIEVAVDGVADCRFGAQSDCASAGVIARLDFDGDVEADREEDEEWAVELKLPWKLLASSGRPAQLPVSLSRVETLGGERVREVWSRGCGALKLE